MNFKIENNFLDINNYPLIEKHFEYMASQGWLIKKILAGSLFIYKKIEPEELDFSISPYEVETFLFKKTKEELEEFQSVCELSGWNYVNRFMNLHIYFKQKGSQAIDLETDDEVEFETIETIAKRKLTVMYIGIPFILFMTCIMFVHGSTELIRSGMFQWATALIIIALILMLNIAIKTNGFLKRNRKNIEIGKKIEYTNYKNDFGKIANLLLSFISIILLFHIIYISIILKNHIALKFLIYGISVSILYYIYFAVIAPNKMDKGFKVIIYITIITVTMMINYMLDFSALRGVVERYNNLNSDKYKVLTSSSFDEEEKVYDGLEGKIVQDISLLTSKAYEYDYYNEEEQYIKTEYSKTLNEDLAKILVNKYIKRAKNDSNRYMWSPEFSMEEDKENRWELDEVYYLNKKKTEVLIREGKEVFYLEGKDFSDPEIIEIVKEKLEL